MTLTQMIRVMVLLGVVVLARGKAHAYTPWSFQYETPFKSTVTPKVLERADEMLALSEEQSDALRQMARHHHEQMQALKEKWEPIKEEMQRKEADLHYLSQERHAMKLEYEKTFAPVADRQVELEEQFYVQVQGILDEYQLEQWHWFYHRVHCEKWLPKTSNYPGSRVDMMLVMEWLEEELGGPCWDVQVMDEMLRQYDAEMYTVSHRAWKHVISCDRKYMRNEKERYFVNDEGRVYMGDGGEQFNRKSIKRMEQRWTDARAVRDINRRHQRSIVGCLPPECAWRCACAIERMGMHGYAKFRKLRTEAFYQSVIELCASDQDQVDAINGILGEHCIRMREARTRMYGAGDLYVDRRSGRASSTIDEQNEAMKKFARAVENRIQMDRDLIDKIWNVLTEEQQSQIEKPEIKNEDVIQDWWLKPRTPPVAPEPPDLSDLP